METTRREADHALVSDERGAARRLVRRTDDRMIGGVCSGLADHFGADPLLFRLGFVVLAVLGLTGVLVYAAAWALIPPAGPSPSGRVRRALPLVGLMLIGIAAVAAVPALVDLMNWGFPLLPGDYGSFHIEPLVMAAALVATGVVLLRPQEETAAAAPAETSLPRPPRPRRERSGLTPLTLAIVLLVLGVAGLGSSGGWVPLDVGQLAALSLVLVGVGLVVGAWFGRARLLIVVGILMIPIVLATSLIDFRATGSIGSPYLHLDRPGTLDDMKVLVGQATLDLADYPFDEGTERVRLRVGAGSMTVIVPHDVRVHADVTIRAGEAFLFDGGYESGFDIAVAGSGGPEDSAKVLDLEIAAGVGSVGIYQMNDPKRHRDRKDRGKDGDRRDRQEGRERREGRDRDRPRDRDRRQS